MQINDFRNLAFRLAQDTPIHSPPRFTPLIADPTVLAPDMTPDHQWHMFAHCVYGVQHFVSGDGIHWKKLKTEVRSALRPYIYREGDGYYLFYEKYAGLKLLFSFLPGQRWYSQLEMISSRDLLHWSEPKVLVRPTLAFHEDRNLGKAISNPCLLKLGDTYRLYYSASLVRVPDCGFNEPLHIAYSESKEIDGNYVPSAEPVLSPSQQHKWNNLGAGSMKVLACEDGFVAFQNGIYEHEGRSGSAICLLSSEDGIRWEYLREAPILQPDASKSWMASHIYACDPRIYNGKLFLYFNARNHAHWSKGSEHIGLAIAELPK